MGVPAAARSSDGAPVAEAGVLRVLIGSTIEKAERDLIELTLEHTGNNRTRAAELLGISQKTLFNKLKEYASGAAE